VHSRLLSWAQVATGNTATSNFFFEKRPWGELMDSMARVMPAIHNAPATVVAGDASAGAWCTAARGQGDTCGDMRRSVVWPHDSPSAVMLPCG
jgi:hypothetical protein